MHHFTFKKGIVLIALGLFLSMLLLGCVGNMSGVVNNDNYKNIGQSAESFHNTKQSRNVVVMLPLTGALSSSGKAIRDGLLAAHYYAKTKGQSVLKIQFFDTNSISVKHLYQKAMSQNADFIVGPLTKNEVLELFQLNSLTVPVLALNTLDDYHKKHKDRFYQFGLSSQDEIIQISDRIFRNSLRRAIVIAPNTAWSYKLVDAFKSNFAHLGGKVVDILMYNENQPEDFSFQIIKLLKVASINTKLENTTAGIYKNVDPSIYRRNDFDVIFLVANPDDARQIRPLLKFHYASNIPVYATSMVYSGKPNQVRDFDLDGIMFCDLPWTLNSSFGSYPYIASAQAEIEKIAINSYVKSNKLYALGIDAYNLIRFVNKEGVFPKNGLSGATGVLFLGKYNHIYRSLDWATFENGMPIRVITPMVGS